MKVKVTFKNNTSVVLKRVENFWVEGDTVKVIYMYRNMRVKGTVNFVKKAEEVKERWIFLKKILKNFFPEEESDFDEEYNYFQ